MDPFASAFSSAYLANIAGALTGGMISGARNRIRKDLEKKETQQALEKCVFMGTIAAVAIPKTETTDQEDLLAEFLVSFLKIPKIAYISDYPAPYLCPRRPGLLV